MRPVCLRLTIDSHVGAEVRFVTVLCGTGSQYLQMVTAAAAMNSSHFRPAQLALVVWSLLGVGADEDRLYASLARSAIDLMDHFEAPDLADLAHAYATYVRQPPPALFDAIALRATAIMDEFDTQQITRVMSAFSAMCLQPVELLEAVETWMDSRIGNLDPQGLVSALLMHAHIGPRPSANVLDIAVESVLRQRDAFTPAQLAKVAPQLLPLLCWPFTMCHRPS